MSADTFRALGVDLAYRRFRDVGAALTTFRADAIISVALDVIKWPDDVPTVSNVSATLDEFARSAAVDIVLIDGPHAWRSANAPNDRPGVGRAAEYAARCPGKTGQLGITYPKTYAGFTAFSIDVFEALLKRPHVTLVNAPRRLRKKVRGYRVAECFPTATWRAAGLVPLPGKRSATPARVRADASALRQRFALPRGALTHNHDTLQAVVASLSGVALLGGPARICAFGEPHRVEAGVGVEGYIFASAPPAQPHSTEGS